MTGSLQIKKGRYYAVYRDSKGKQKWVFLGLSAAGNNKRKANALLKQALEKAEKEQLTNSVDILFTDWLLSWLDQKEASITKGTYESYKLYLEKHIIPYFIGSNLMLCKVNAQHLQKYYNDKIKDGLSACTLHKHSAVINGALGEAVLKDMILANPADKVTLPKKKRYHGVSYTLQETRMLLSCSKNDSLYPAIVLGLFYGLRRSEVLGLRWCDINFDEKFIYIHRTITRIMTTDEKDQTKNECSRRVLRLIPGTVPYLKDLMEHQKNSLAGFGKTFTMDQYICAWPDGRSLGPDYISRHFQRILEKNNLPKIRFHDLRHTAGSLLLADGVDIKSIQEFLGHSQPSTTANIYLHSVVRDGYITANSLSRIIE